MDRPGKHKESGLVRVGAPGFQKTLPKTLQRLVINEKNGGLFGAPLDDKGTPQGAVDADLVVLPGGVLLVEQSSPLAKLPAFRCTVSGNILCENGRH